MVKHPTYIRQSLQIRERCGFESRQVYQFAIVLITCLLISRLQMLETSLQKSVWPNMITIRILLFVLIVQEMKTSEFKNAKQWEFLKKNPRYRFPGQSLNKCFGQPKESVIHRVETTNNKTVLYYKSAIKPCVGVRNQQ